MNHEKRKILVVEDNPISGEDFKRRLKVLGYSVAGPVLKGENVIQTVAEENPDLILMDIRLKGEMNGIEAATKVRNHYQTPVIYLTAHADRETVQRAKQTEPYGYMVKPFDDKELRSSIEIALYKKEADKKIRESRQWLRTTLKSIGDGVIATDERGLITFMNPIAEHLTGWSENDAMGRPMEGIFHAVNENSLARIENFVERIVRRNKVIGLDNHTLLLSKDGRQIPIADSGAPITDDSGHTIGTVIVFRDQTEERALRKSLEESQRIYMEAQDIAKIGNWVWNINTGQITWSDALFKIFNLSKQEITFDLVKSMVHPDDLNLWLTTVQKAVDNKTPFSLEYRVKEENEKSIWIHNRTQLVKKGNDHIFYGTAQDITDRKNSEKKRFRLERQLKQAQKMEAIGNLAGGIAHDFNNILSSVIGFTELAMDDFGTDSTLRDYLHEVYSAGKRARELVKQILAFARQSDEEIKPVQVGTIVKEVLKFIRSSIPTNIEIRQNIDSHSLIMGNPTQVHQIMMNLCTNAAFAMEGEGGILDVRLNDIEIVEKDSGKKSGLKPGHYIEIILSDTGTGIAPEHLGSIFEPYFTTKEPGKGTGMGLAMVHGIVEGYGGKIIADSMPGDGSVFTIYLPITSNRKYDRVLDSTELPSGTERILIVDDEPPIANIESKILKRLGYSVKMSTSSLEAIALFKSKSNDFDLVITDMTMPGMTGDRLAMELMKIRPDIPVILCTGYSRVISEESALAIGIKAIAYKPIVKADLAKIVRKVLDETRSQL